MVRTSLLAALVGAHAFQGTAYTVAGHVGRAQGNHHPSLSPYGLFHCQDGDIQVACGSESLWVKLAQAFDIDPATPGMATNRERTVNRDQVTAALNAAFAAYPLDELLPRLAELGIPAGEVRTIDRVYDWDQTRSQGLVLDVDHPVLGRIEIPGRRSASTTTRMPVGAASTSRHPRWASTTRASAPGSTRWTTRQELSARRASYHR